LVIRSQAGTMARSNLQADGTCTTTESAPSQQKPSPRGNVGSKLRSPVDGGLHAQRPDGPGTVSTRLTERLPVYGSATSDMRSVPPDGSGSVEQHSSGSTPRLTMTATAAATAASQVTFQDPIESKYISYTTTTMTTNNKNIYRAPYVKLQQALCDALAPMSMDLQL